MYLKTILFNIVISFSITAIYGQKANSLKVSGEFNQIELQSALDQLSEDFSIKFYYKKEWINGKIIANLSLKDKPIQEAIASILTGQGLSFIFRKPNHVVLLLDKGKNNPLINISKNNANEVLTIGAIDLTITRAQLSGTITEGENNAPLEGAVVTVENTNIRVVTGGNGNYSLTLVPGKYDIRYHHQTMEDFEVTIDLNSNGKLNVEMYADVIRLEEIVVSDEAIDQNVSETITGQETIDIEKLKKIPAFLGEVDVLNSVLSLPGVNKVGEGASGYNVRGSNVGQNLILIDDAPIYNPSHLFGFFTAFNSEIVDKIVFHRGSIPANYGGRIASVLDVSIDDGNKEKFEGNGGVGFLNSRFSIQGPIKKNVTSFAFASRGAYPNYIIRQLEDIELNNSSAYFVDGNLKINHIINPKNRISLSGYYSRDQFALSSEAEYNYGNKTASVEWNTTLKTDFFLDIKANLSNYDYKLKELNEPQIASSLFSDLKQATLSLNFNRIIKNHNIEFGSSILQYNIQPGDYTPASSESIIEPLSIDNEEAQEAALFIGDQLKVNDNLFLYGGLRYSLYNGGRDNLSTTYHGLEPRFSINYRLTETTSVKTGYNRMRQYIHFISNTTAATPIDIWKLGNESLSPTIGDQVTLGLFKNLKNNSIETSAEVFYKATKNQVEYRNGADLFLNKEIESEVVQGEGLAYGIELLINKLKGKLQGWVSYTYSRSKIQVQNTDKLLSINNGSYFPTNFDQPHNISVFGNLQVSRRFSVNANFNYNTGRPITYPETVYEIGGLTIADYSERNKYRIPDYHRLDVSFTMATSLKRKKNVSASWTLSIYNLYGRKNAYSVYFKKNPITNEQESYKLAVIGRPVVGLTYNFKF
ncbi:TonB-dependent receptor [Fulvivirga sp.]|uniref:TonB-dependent receptor n=1 Tax=Fulvivirga sp. TaxID=1931237 RepID=UPI0032EF9EAC